VQEGGTIIRFRGQIKTDNKVENIKPDGFCSVPNKLFKTNFETAIYQ
jgi:hypothetical protein